MINVLKNMVNILTDLLSERDNKENLLELD